MTPDTRKEAAHVFLSNFLDRFNPAVAASAKGNLDYRLKNNTDADPATLAEDALRRAIVTVYSAAVEWDIVACLQLAAELMENVNDHHTAAFLYTKLNKLKSDDSDTELHTG